MHASPGLAIVALLLLAPRAQQPDLPAGFPVFPADNPWNWDISGHAVHPASATYIAAIGAADEVRADFAFEINLVTGATPLVAVAFGGSANESDPGPGFGSPLGPPPGAPAGGSYRIPAGARVEGGGVGDAHCIVVDTTNRLLYETYRMNAGGPPWSATNGAVFDLDSNALRPDGWTSGDAAGLPIFPGLLRYDEILAGQITHALRVTVPSTRDTHLYPARHDAGVNDASLPPMGLRLRLKSTFNTAAYTGTPRIVLEALKKHGLIVADNGTQWYVSTTVDDRWQSDVPYINSTTQGLRALRGSDFEAVLTVDGSGNPIPPSGLPGGVGGGGGGGGGGCGTLGLEAALIVLLLARLRRRA